MANTLHFSATLQAAASPVFSKRTNKMHCKSLRVQTGNYNSVAACLAQSRSDRVLKVSCEAASVDVLEMNITNNQAEKQLTCVMKFGGSSLASAERMREVAGLILSFPNESPVIVLSAMGKTTNKLLLAGEKAVSCGVTNVDSIEELSFIKELHLRTTKELEVDESVIAKHLDELEQLLNGIAMMKELTPRTKDYLVSFGECMSTRIFAAYMNKIGAKARQAELRASVFEAIEKEDRVIEKDEGLPPALLEKHAPGSYEKARLRFTCLLGLFLDDSVLRI